MIGQFWWTAYLCTYLICHKCWGENCFKEKLLRNLTFISCLIHSHLYRRKKCSRTVTLHILFQTCGFNIQPSGLLNIPKDHESLWICKIKIQLTLLLYVLLCYSLNFVSVFFHTHVAENYSVPNPCLSVFMSRNQCNEFLRDFMFVCLFLLCNVG
jgi:hypothetical protein